MIIYVHINTAVANKFRSHNFSLRCLSVIGTHAHDYDIFIYFVWNSIDRVCISIIHAHSLREDRVLNIYNDMCTSL